MNTGCRNSFNGALTPLLVLLLHLLPACSDTGMKDPENDDTPHGTVIGPVPPDGRLEVVTWNIEWFGSGDRGPENERLQRDNVIRVLDSLDADLYALQEIKSREELTRITRRMDGFRGFVAEDIDWIQKTAFIYNTLTIDSLSSGLITRRQNGFDWANGRYPMFFSFNYRYNSQVLPVFAVVIHAKASTDHDSYLRRVRAADSLYAYLINEKPNTNIILLGDFNDDVDLSIIDNQSPSPYQSFTGDTANFLVVTRSISAAGRTSFLGTATSDLVDHIVLSNELEDEYITGSEQIFSSPLNYIDRYGSTTSDHLPVWVKLNISGNE